MMNSFVRALVKMSESTMESDGYVRGLIRTYGGEVSGRAKSKRG